MPLFLDLPSFTIAEPGFVIAGWIAGRTLDAVEVLVNGGSIPYRLSEEPALSHALPGFACVRRVATRAHLVHCSGLPVAEIELRFGQEVLRKEIPLSTEMVEFAAREARLRARSFAWLSSHLRCPACRGGDLELTGTEIRCRGCEARFPQLGRAIHLLSDEQRARSSIFHTENVSGNPYTPLAKQVIDDTVGGGGWVLDCGAGNRSERTPGVVNVEIEDHPSTDVIAAGEALPFADGSFDAALSLSVLEHVRDPFQCSRELLRVVKPGGTILVDVPLLQPVHGYPSHYYNMTRAGAVNLFSAGADVVSVETPLHGHPIWALQWIVRAYLDGLPVAVREPFAKRTLAEIAEPVDPARLTLAEVATLEAGATESLACLNTLLLRKRG